MFGTNFASQVKQYKDITRHTWEPRRVGTLYAWGRDAHPEPNR